MRMDFQQKIADLEEVRETRMLLSVSMNSNDPEFLFQSKLFPQCDWS